MERETRQIRPNAPFNTFRSGVVIEVLRAIHEGEKNRVAIIDFHQEIFPREKDHINEVLKEQNGRKFASGVSIVRSIQTERGKAARIIFKRRMI